MDWIKTNWETPKKDGWYLCWMYYGGWEKLYYWWDYDVFSEDAERYTKEDEHRAYGPEEVLYWAEVEEPEEGKWFHTDRETRLKGYIDKKLSGIRKELYNLIGAEEK